MNSIPFHSQNGRFTLSTEPQRLPPSQGICLPACPNRAIPRSENSEANSVWQWPPRPVLISTRTGATPPHWLKGALGWYIDSGVRLKCKVNVTGNKPLCLDAPIQPVTRTVFRVEVKAGVLVSRGRGAIASAGGRHVYRCGQANRVRAILQNGFRFQSSSRPSSSPQGCSLVTFANSRLGNKAALGPVGRLFAQFSCVNGLRSKMCQQFLWDGGYDNMLKWLHVHCFSHWKYC